MSSEKLQSNEMSVGDQLGAHTKSQPEEELQRRRVCILEQWQHLLLSAQASLLIDLAQSVLASDVGEAVRRALGLDASAETASSENQPIPISWVHTDDLIWCRPDLAEKIRALRQSQVQHIADKIGDALQETYWMTMGTILDDYLDREDAQDDTDEAYIVVDYDVFYTDSEYDPGMQAGWYFWFLDQHYNIVGEPIGPWEDAKEAMRSGKVAVRVYYDTE